MFIMKGLPGSGKTFIGEVIQEVYKDTCVCSADHYFMQDGVYEFDREKLKEAHEYCQQQAASAAEQSIHVIVIDNTNLKHWEMKFYLNLARTHLYIPVVVEPQTTWAVHPAELAVKNIHNIPEEILSDKIKAYQPVLPIYYGWFLNEVDSEEICSIGWSWFQKALGVQDFVEHFSQAFQADSNEDLHSFFAQDIVADRRRVLHATSKFTARGKSMGANEYINSPVVKQSLGKGFRLCVVGFVITTRTIGARLKLTKEQLELWSSDDHEDPPVTLLNSGVLKKHQFSHSNSDRSKEKFRFSKYKNTSVCLPSVTEREIFCDEDRFYPTSGKGSRAHLTLACAPGIKPVTTGFDLILAVRCEQRMRKGENQKAETYVIDGGILMNYGEGIWVVYPNSEMLVSSLFSAFV
ncbi:2',3'-cyclic-nucleotide 3'-phosphodiesterase-like isoform X2 [Scylla paramamosain]